MRQRDVLGAAVLAACLLATCGPAAPQRRPAAPQPPPHPYSRNPAEILANIAAHAHQAGMDQGAGYERLGRSDGSLVVGELLDVTSEVELPDYYIVRLDDRASGTPVYGVCISKEGWILMTATANTRVAARPRLDEVVRRLTARFGPTRAQYAYAYGTIEPGGSLFAPLVRAETPVGRL